MLHIFYFPLFGLFRFSDRFRRHRARADKRQQGDHADCSLMSLPKQHFRTGTGPELTMERLLEPASDGVPFALRKRKLRGF